MLLLLLFNDHGVTGYSGCMSLYVISIVVFSVNCHKAAVTLQFKSTEPYSLNLRPLIAM
jgi:hypothetical protein